MQSVSAESVAIGAAGEPGGKLAVLTASSGPEKGRDIQNDTKIRYAAAKKAFRALTGAAPLPQMGWPCRPPQPSEGQDQR